MPHPSSLEKHVAVFKPTDKEPLAKNNAKSEERSPNGEGLKKGTKVGEGALRDAAMYVLDRGFYGLPTTSLVQCLHESFNHPGDIKPKIRSLQSI